ncbi:MAG: translocation/assembly module TamB domain-containing protein [Acidobacteriaceae bacterium]
MRDEHNTPQQPPEPTGEHKAAPGQDASAAPQPRKPHFTRHFLRISAAVIGVASLLVLVILALAFWYSTTSGFENRVRNIVITQLEQSTGGRVQLGALHVNLAQLGIEADNLTIHGKEAPGQIPYFHADQLAVHLKIIDLFAGKIGLSYLGLTRPTIHIIVYPDGSTNQPTPRAATIINAKSISTQIFSLAIDQAQLNDGLFILNARKYRFNIQASSLRANLSYDRLRNRYLGNFAAHDILLQRGNATPVTSRLYIQINAAPNHIHLDHLTFLTGDSRLNIAGTLNHFAHPQFHGRANGSLDLRILDPLAGVTGIQSGVLHLQAQANGTPANYAVQGTAHLDNLLYHPAPQQTISLSAQSQLMLTQDEISATAFHAQFTGGGSASGNLRILHWLRNAAAATPAPIPKHTLRWFFRHKKTPPSPAPRPEPPLTGEAHLQFASLPLATLLQAVTTPQFSDLGFNTNISGPVDAHWTTSLRTLTATTSLQLAPGNPSAPGDVPVTGKISGSYAFAAGAVQLRALDLHTPGTQAQASGSIGVNPSMRGSKITGSVITHNLAEFDKILAVLNVQPQSQPLPFDLHGNAAFRGAVTGALTAPDVQGHLDASNVDIAFETSSTPPAQPVTHSIHVDSAQASLDFSPRHFTLSAVTLRAGEATANASLTITATQTGKNTFTLNNASPITGQATLNNATLNQLMPLLGTQLPVTGTLALQLQLAGTLGNPNGSGSLTVNGGDVYGEPYRDLQSNLALANHSLQATNILYRQVGGQVHGSAQLDLNSRQFHFDLTGSGFHLARVHRLQTPNYPLGGVLDFQAQGSGTLQNPSISANLHLAQLQFADAATGSVDATAQLQNQSLTLDAAAHLNQSLVQLHGQATLTGNDPAQAKLTITNLDLNPLAKTFHIAGIASRRPINATATLSGPLRTPQALSGDIHIQPIALSLANVDVQSTSSIHAALKNGTLTLDSFHIKGSDVDVQADGSIGLSGNTHPIQWNTRGSINMKVAQTFSDEITSSGMVTFNVSAGGTVHHPSLNGQATIKDVNLASDDYINGLSRINGTLKFNEGRVELQNVTAYSGGGPIQLSGSATYAAGLYLNIKATAQGVRVRYPVGVTSTVDAKMQLQGGIQSLLLSGNVQVTHFAVNSTMDLVSIVNSSSGPSLPPNPKSFANRVRLDIHVTSSPSMDFQNSFAKLAGTVNLHIRGTAALPSILGQITITEGQATLAGTTYQLQRGVIYFNNPIRIEPTIDLDATTRVENYDITIGLHGTPSKLQPVFRSSPPLSEQDIFSLLALGRTQEEQQIYSQQQSQAGINPAANALLGSAINATVSSRIQKLFGGGSVKINPAYVTTSGNATARLTVQQQIGRNFTLTYATNVNSSAEQLIQGKLDITPNLSILAVRDETGVFSLIFTIRKRYK